MATPIPTNQIQNLQTIEATVAGPDGANRLFIISGHAPATLTAVGPQGGTIARNTETFTLLVGPTLTRRQFVRASAIASMIGINAYLPIPDSAQQLWQILGVDADWDDEAQQTELRVELSTMVTGSNNQVTISGFAFQVTVLAEMPA
jgi:hypothetical protein